MANFLEDNDRTARKTSCATVAQHCNLTRMNEIFHLSENENYACSVSALCSLEHWNTRLYLYRLCVPQILSCYVYVNAFGHLLNKRILID